MGRRGRIFSKWRPISSRKSVGETIFHWRGLREKTLTPALCRHGDSSTRAYRGEGEVGRTSGNSSVVQARSYSVAGRAELAERLAGGAAAAEAYAFAAEVDHSGAHCRSETESCGDCCR